MTRRTTRFLTLTGVVAVTTLALGASRSSTHKNRVPLDGDLPVALGQITSDQLFQFGRTLRFDNGPVQQRICARAGCNGRVDGVRDQVPGPANISDNGTIVARLVNLGRAGSGEDEGDEAVYHTARENGQVDFYIVAVKSRSGWSWSIRRAVRGETTPPAELASGNWISCRHDPNNPNHPRGKSEFARCPNQGGAGALFPPNDPAWITCSDGCCTAGTF